MNQSAFAFGKILLTSLNEKYFFSEVKLLKTLRDVKKVAQLICFDVLYSQVKDTFRKDGKKELYTGWFLTADITSGINKSTF